jgi:hypothetical protein
MIGEVRALRHGIWPRNMSVLLVASVLALLGALGHGTEAGQPAAPSAKPPDAQRLVGRWVRPDGGYILEVREVRKDGSLNAAYFNPRPINVAKAELRRKDGKLTVFVELRDINYPGSTYTLQYDPASDNLKRTYYQAVEKQTHSIEFLRGR